MSIVRNAMNLIANDARHPTQVVAKLLALTAALVAQALRWLRWLHINANACQNV